MNAPTKHRDLTDADRLEVLRMLIEGKTILAVSQITGLAGAKVMAVANFSGHPNIERMQEARDRLLESLDAAKRPAAPQPVARPTLIPPVAVARTTSRTLDLITEGERSAKAKTRNLAARILALLGDLQKALDHESGEAQALAEIEELEAKLRAAKAKLRPTGNQHNRGGHGSALTNARLRQQADLDRLGVTADEVKAWQRATGRTVNGSLISRAALADFEASRERS